MSFCREVSYYALGWFTKRERGREGGRHSGYCSCFSPVRYHVSVNTTELEKGGCGIRNMLACDELHHVAGETSASHIDEVVGAAGRIPTAEDGATY